MASQEENLLTNPRFADPNDPSFTGIRAVDWENRLREALAIEVSSRKGDWSVPTEAEIGQAAAEMIGVVPPSFTPTPEPEPEPEPEPTPERTATAKEVIIQMRSATTVEELEQALPEGEGRKTVLKVFDSLKNKLTEPEPTAVEGHWRVHGDSKTKQGSPVIYEVTLYADGSWGCSCPSREDPCKHSRDIAFRLANAAEPTPEEPISSVPTHAPQTHPSRFRPTRNTATPDEGIMIGGGKPPTPEDTDPWAPKKESKDRVIGVGGTVRFGPKK